MPTLPLPPLADLLATLTVAGLFAGGLLVAAVTAYLFTRSRAAAPDAPAAPASDAVREMRALGDRIETLVAQQQVHGETQRQRLAQTLDGVQQAVTEQRTAVDGLRGELRHEIRRRDAEMEAIRQQIAQIAPALPPPPAALPAAEPLSEWAPDPASDVDHVAAPESDEAPPSPTVDALALADDPLPLEAVSFDDVPFEDIPFEDIPFDAPFEDDALRADLFEEMPADEVETAPPAEPATTPFAEVTPPGPAEADALFVDVAPDADELPAVSPADEPAAQDADEVAIKSIDLSEFVTAEDGWDTAGIGSDVFSPVSLEGDAPEPEETAPEEPAPAADPSSEEVPEPHLAPFAVPGTTAEADEAVPQPPEGEGDPFELFTFDPVEFEPFNVEAESDAAGDSSAELPAFDGVSGDSFNAPPVFSPWTPGADAAPSDALPADPFAFDGTDGAGGEVPFQFVEAPADPPVAPPASVAPPVQPPTPIGDAAWVARTAPADEPSGFDVPVFATPAFGTPEPVASAPAPAPEPAAPPQNADDLTILADVDEALQRRLYDAGVVSLEEIAQWGRADARRVAMEVQVAEDTIMHQWVFEAQAALFRRYTHGSV